MVQWFDWAQTINFTPPWLARAKEHGYFPLALEQIGSRPTSQRDKDIQIAEGLLSTEVTDSDSSTNRVDQNETIWKYSWCEFAWNEGKKILIEKPNFSIPQIADRVAQSMEQEGIKGRGGKVLSAETIRRHALTGIKS